jgi:beta-lactamase regulating signal transducer with metallopeptidase domain
MKTINEVLILDLNNLTEMNSIKYLQNQAIYIIWIFSINLCMILLKVAEGLFYKIFKNFEENKSSESIHDLILKHNAKCESILLRYRSRCGGRRFLCKHLS